MDAVAHSSTPFNDFGQVTIPLHRWLIRIDRPVQVTAILNGASHALQGLGQAGNPERLRSHRPAAMACADITRRADQGDFGFPCGRFFATVMIFHRPSIADFMGLCQILIEISRL